MDLGSDATFMLRMIPTSIILASSGVPSRSVQRQNALDSLLPPQPPNLSLKLSHPRLGFQPAGLLFLMAQ